MDQTQSLRNMINSQNQKQTISRVITVTSGKGGVGKSSISVNLAVELMQLEKKVIILDADFGLANVEVMLGIRPQYTMADMLFNGKSLSEIITNTPHGIGFISGGSGIQELSNLTKEQMLVLSQHLYELDTLADFIIIDTGAGIANSVIEPILASEEVLLVTTPEPTSITDAYALLKMLNKNPNFNFENTVIKLLANRVTNKEEGLELYDKLNQVVTKFLQVKFEFITSIPQDVNVSRAIIQQKPFAMEYPNSIASKAIKQLACLLCEKEIEKKSNKRGIAWLFSNLIRSKTRK